MLNSVGSGRPFLVTRVTADSCTQSATLVHGVRADQGVTLYTLEVVSVISHYFLGAVQ